LREDIEARKEALLYSADLDHSAYRELLSLMRDIDRFLTPESEGEETDGR
jgi:hypothetical protein